MGISTASRRRIRRVARFRTRPLMSETNSRRFSKMWRVKLSDAQALSGCHALMRSVAMSMHVFRRTSEVSDGDERQLRLQLRLIWTAHPRSLHRLVRPSRRRLPHKSLSCPRFLLQVNPAGRLPVVSASFVAVDSCETVNLALGNLLGGDYFIHRHSVL